MRRYRYAEKLTELQSVHKKQPKHSMPPNYPNRTIEQYARSSRNGNPNSERRFSKLEREMPVGVNCHGLSHKVAHES